MIRPTSPGGLVLLQFGLLYGLLWAPLVFIPASEQMALLPLLWALPFLVLVPPCGLLAGHVAGRVQAGVRGGQTERRWLWTFAGIAALTAAHWAPAALVAPVGLVLSLFDGRLDRALPDLAITTLAWLPLGLGLWGARAALTRLEAATPSGPWPRSSWSVPVLAALFYGVGCGVPLVSGFSVLTHEAPAWLGPIWVVVGLVLCGVPARVASRLDGAPTQELFGLLWATHWGLAFVLCIAHRWSPGHRGTQLGLSLLAIAMVMLGVGLWAQATKRRWLSTEPGERVVAEG
ncbi:MAG: hypothetical protein ACI8PZ_005932 [Myxococcota bacterium]|jgi:hypothetical protein